MQFQVGPMFPLSASAPPRYWDGYEYCGWLYPQNILAADNQHAVDKEYAPYGNWAYGAPLWMTFPRIPAAATVKRMIVEYRAAGSDFNDGIRWKQTYATFRVYVGETAVRQLFMSPQLVSAATVYTFDTSNPASMPTAAEMTHPDFRFAVLARVRSNFVDPPGYCDLYVDYVKVTIYYEFRAAHVAVGVSQIY